MSGGTRSFEFAKRLVASGHDVHVITSDRDKSGAPYDTEEEGIRVTWIPVRYKNDMGPIARIRAFSTFALKSAARASSSQADLVFATSTPLTIAIPGVIAKWRQRIPMVFEVRDLWPEMPIAMGVLRDPISRRLARGLERFAYRNANRIIALSPGMKDGIAATGYPSDRVVVIPNLSDIDRFQVDPTVGQQFRQQHEWLGDRPLVVYAGTLGAVNGVSYLVDVAATMLQLDADVRFLVVGAGKERQVVEDFAKRSGVLNRNLFMMQSMPKSSIPQILSAADVCTSLFIDIPQMWSNSANKVFDALAAGRVVAVNYSGWQRELLEQSRAGLYLSADSPKEGASTLLEMLHDPGRLQRSQECSLNLAHQRFSSDALAAKFEDVLSDALQGRNAQ